MYKLKKIESSDDKYLEETLTEWQSQADKLGDIGILLSTDISRIFREVKHKVAQKPFHAYFLHEESNKQACAILEIIHAKPGFNGSWLKLLDITVEPSLNLDSYSDIPQSQYKKLSSVFGYSISSSINLLSNDFKEVGKIKIYGRTSFMDALFSLILSQNELDETLKKFGLSAKKEGRWLVVEKI